MLDGDSSCSSRLRGESNSFDLAERANALAGRSIDDVAAEIGFDVRGAAERTKGKIGELVERALGATGGSSAVHDFPELGIELKTIPLAHGTPRESTYVCTVPIADAEHAEWATSWAREKMQHVLWMPFDVDSRRFGAPLFWKPTCEQERVLEADFDEAIGAIAIGGIEGLSARTGRFMQVRPKARDGQRRLLTRGRDNEIIATVPRGFYLRARFTAAILRDPAALP